jgi:hypothetical protein
VRLTAPELRFVGSVRFSGSVNRFADAMRAALRRLLRSLADHHWAWAFPRSPIWSRTIRCFTSSTLPGFQCAQLETVHAMHPTTVHDNAHGFHQHLRISRFCLPAQTIVSQAFAPLAVKFHLDGGRSARRQSGFLRATHIQRPPTGIR